MKVTVFADGTIEPAGSASLLTDPQRLPEPIDLPFDYHWYLCATCNAIFVAFDDMLVTHQCLPHLL